MKCRSLSPPLASPPLASDAIMSSPASTSAGKISKRRSSVKLLGNLGRAESSSNLSTTGSVSATSNSGNNIITPSQLIMQPVLDDTTITDHHPCTPPLTATNNNYNATTSSAINQAAHRFKANINNIQTDLQNLAHRRQLPRPLPTSKCPLLCVFYSEFDIVIGPTVCFQAPPKFMHFDVNVGFEEVHQALEETFQSVMSSQTQHEGEKLTDFNSDDYWNWSPTKERENYDAAQSSQVTLPMSSHHLHEKKISQATDSLASEQLSPSAKESKAKNNDASQVSVNDTNTTVPSTTHHHRSPSYASSKGTTSNPTTHEGDNSTIDTELLANSIFAATSEYIITGNELANQTITVSTHGMHILSRPMIIKNTQRYERNSHLFAVGFVLRRNIDPRPFWPVLSNLSFTLRDMEVESEFLSNQRTRPQIQYLLEDILLSLNTKQRDCHLLLDDANLLNLCLFRPPPPPIPPVSDHTVPILLRPEWQVQMFDWDLTINWIIPHIDGCKHTKLIAQSSEVDMEMVRACLRVLRHHGVLAHVDVFRYSNVYEITPRGKEILKSKEGEHMLREAYMYAVKLKNVQSKLRGGILGGDSSPSVTSTSPFTSAAGRLHPQLNSLNSLELSANGAGSFGWSSAVAGWSRRLDEVSSSFPRTTGNLTIAEEDESGEEHAPPQNLSSSLNSARSVKGSSDAAHREADMMKNALSQIYASCNRSHSFGEILVEKMSMGPVASNKKASSSAKSNADSANIEWENVFDHFDHRRLITFGIIRGVIRRVHQYPLAYEIGDNDDKKRDSGDPVDDESNTVASDPFGFDMNSRRKGSLDISMVAAKAAAVAQNGFDDGSRSNGTPTFPISPLLQGIPVLHQKDYSKKKPTKKKPTVEVIALAMNGMRCDDELSCMFDAPVEKLVEAVEKTGRWNVISIFSCTN